jgi:DNA end-binding protein Ku
VEARLPSPEDLEQEEEGTSSRPFWSGTITFGLVSIPVSLYPANRTSRVSLHMLSPEGHRLKRRFYSENSGKDLEDEELVRGYEWEDGRYIEISDEELERLAPEKTRDIDLRRFVNESAIPRMMFERAYFLVPDGGSNRAYRLLAETMRRTGRAGIATFVMRGKEYLIALLSENGILRAETLRFHDEVRTPEDVGLPAPVAADDDLVKEYVKLIGKLSSDELPRDQMKDERSRQVLNLVEEKRARGEDLVSVAVEDESGGEGEGEVADLLKVLQMTLAKTGAKQPPPEKQATPANRTAPAKQGAKPKPGAASDLERHSRKQLLDQAKELDIRGRSGMSKEELIEAIRGSTRVVA